MMWTRVHAGEYVASADDGTHYLIRKVGRDSATGHSVWAVFANDEFRTTEFGLARAKRNATT